jgi:hypothetical protein
MASSRGRAIVTPMLFRNWRRGKDNFFRNIGGVSFTNREMLSQADAEVQPPF